MSTPPGTQTPAAFAPVDNPETIVPFSVPIIGGGAAASAVASVFSQSQFVTARSVFSYADTQAAERRAVAVRFARFASNIQGVREVRVAELMPNLEVVVVMSEEDLGRELELRGIFIDLVCDELDPSVGELFVFAEDDAPTWVRESTLLT
jgi:hypothetical protein